MVLPVHLFRVLIKITGAAPGAWLRYSFKTDLTVQILTHSLAQFLINVDRSTKYR